MTTVTSERAVTRYLIWGSVVVIVAYLMMTVLLVILINLLVDILYSVLDPRVRYGEARA